MTRVKVTRKKAQAKRKRLRKIRKESLHLLKKQPTRVTLQAVVVVVTLQAKVTRAQAKREAKSGEKKKSRQNLVKMRL